MLDSFTPTSKLEQQRIRALVASLDLNDSKAIIQFGTEAQRKVTETADRLLNGIKNKDSGAGDLLTRMVSVLKGFQGAEKQLNKKRNFFDKLRGKAEPMIIFKAQFEDVSAQIDAISNELEKTKQSLLVDISSLDRLYDATLEYFHDLEYYLTAATEVLRHADENTIPALKAKAETNSDILDSQRLRDHQTHRDELERRFHDLLLTRQVTLQALPSLRLIQENDKSLVNKINSTLINTVPLWRQQLAQTIALHRSQKAAEAIKASADLTNDLLTRNAETLKQSNRDIRQQTERGIFDIEKIEAANRNLIETLEESVQLTSDARSQRKAAETRLQQAENDLKAALQALSHKKNTHD